MSEMIRVRFMYDRGIGSLVAGEEWELELPAQWLWGYGSKHLVVGNDLELGISLTYRCAHCRSELRQWGAMSDGHGGGEAILRCQCGEWKGTASPISGSWVGGEVKYWPYSPERRETVKEEEINTVRKKWQGK